MTAVTIDPECDQCGRGETVCARNGVCCESCTHWDDLDDEGNDRLTVAAARTYQGVRAHGSEDTYLAHLEAGTQPCTPCRRAHRQHKVQQVAAAIRDPYHFDALYRESIPLRISRTPPTFLGPTAQWLEAHPGEPVEQFATVHQLHEESESA